VARIENTSLVRRSTKHGRQSFHRRSHRQLTYRRRPWLFPFLVVSAAYAGLPKTSLLRWLCCFALQLDQHSLHGYIRQVLGQVRPGGSPPRLSSLDSFVL
jgi:hypothetical protein